MRSILAIGQPKGKSDMATIHHRSPGAWALLLALLLSGKVLADIGTYTATVTALNGTYALFNPGGAVLNGTYKLPVVIEDDTVTTIIWPDGTRINVTNGMLHGLQASVMSYQGQRFQIVVTDDRFHREDPSNDSVSDSRPDDD
jgi:hypothetical protein